MNIRPNESKIARVVETFDEISFAEVDAVLDISDVTVSFKNRQHSSHDVLRHKTSVIHASIVWLILNKDFHLCH